MGFFMRVRSILLSTAVLLSTAGVSSAIAASTVLKPQGTWAVTKVEAKQPGSAPYCALARRFGNGSVVTFARNANNETSVAVDFPPNSFKPSQNYTVMLDPGSGESRSYKTQPISERGIVIRMGRDDKFYAALEQTGKLSISVDDKSYAFNMSDVKSGTQDLSACLGMAIEPAAGEAVVTNGNIAPPPPVPGRVPSKTEKMVSEALPDRAAPAPGSLAVGSSGDEMQSLKEENIRLRNALERERRSYEDRMQQSDSSPNAAELSEKVQLLQAENIQLKDKLGSSPAAKDQGKGGTSVAASCPTDSAFDALKTENTKLKSDLDTAQKQASLTPVAAVKGGDDKTVVALRAENTQLKADLDQEKQKVSQLEIAQRTFVDKKPLSPDRGEDALVKTLKEQLTKLEDENSKLKLAAVGKPAAAATSEDMKAGVASIAKMHTLEEQLASVTADRDRLNAQIGSMKLAETGPGAKISSDNWNLETATQRYNEAEREIQRLGSAVEAERAKCIVEKKNIEYMLFDPKIATKQQIAKLMSLENQLAEAKQGMDIARDKSIKDLTAQLADAKKISDASIDKVAANDKVVSDLTAQLEAAKTQNVAANDKVVSDLKMQLATATSQSAELQKSLEAAKTQNLAANDKVVSDLKAQLVASNSQVAMLQKSVEDVKTQNLAANDRTVVDLKTQLAAANAQVAQTQKGIEDAKAQSLAANDKVINDMKLQLVTSNSQVAQLQKALDEANHQKQAQNDQAVLVNSLKQEIISLNNQMSNMQAEKTASVAGRVAGIAPSAGGDASVSRVSARPETVVPAVQVDTEGLSRPAVAAAQTAPAIAPVNAAISQPTSIMPVAVVAAVAPPVPVMAPAVVQPVSSASVAAVQPMKVVTPIAAMPVQAIASATASDSKLMGVGDVRTLLSQAGVKLSSDITPVPNGSGAGRVSYRWKSDGLFGTIEQKTMDNAAQYDSMVQAYVEKTKSRCKGQFAAIPGPSGMNGGTRSSAYEIACVDDKSGEGASASVAFYSQNGTFVTVAHEASSDSMDIAMDARDKIMAAVDSGAKSASR
jgi:hypothetical protein